MKEREQALQEQRRAAEEVLVSQQELLKKELQLDKEEQEIRMLINQAVECHQHQVTGTPEVSSIATPTVGRISSRVTDVPEEVSNGYSTGTFESVPEEVQPTTSTPSLPLAETPREPQDGVCCKLSH